MTVLKRLTKIGNSYAIIIPYTMLADLGLLKKKKVKITQNDQVIQIESPEGRQDIVMRLASKYLKKYHDDFKKLAE